MWSLSCKQSSLDECWRLFQDFHPTMIIKTCNSWIDQLPLHDFCIYYDKEKIIKQHFDNKEFNSFLKKKNTKISSKKRYASYDRDQFRNIHQTTRNIWIFIFLHLIVPFVYPLVFRNCWWDTPSRSQVCATEVFSTLPLSWFKFW